jgi:hypothetical protein
LAVEDTIKNKAEIYFDFQKPVVTNHAKTAVVHNLSVAEVPNKNSSLKVYPNPAADFVYFENLENAPINVVILDMYGRLIKSIEIDSLAKDSIEIQSLKTGSYIVSSGNAQFKLIVH